MFLNEFEWVELNVKDILITLNSKLEHWYRVVSAVERNFSYI